MQWLDKVINLLKHGNETGKPLNSYNELMASDAIDLFMWAAKNHPRTFIDNLLVHAPSPMSTLGMLAVLTQAPTKYLTDTNYKSFYVEILSNKSPRDLLELMQTLRSKVYGKGLGSNSQKIFRSTMEGWPPSILEGYCQKFPKEVYALTRIIHPRFNGAKGKIIQKLLSNPPK